MNEEEEIEGITFVGLCTDICVISNALLAKALRRRLVYVDVRAVRVHRNRFISMWLTSGIA